MVDVPIPAPPEGAPLSVKLGYLWLTNKPLFILIVFLTVVIIGGIIFLIVWFAFLAPKQKKAD